VSLSSLGTTSYLFGGELFDVTVQKYHLRARYYDQTSGFFASRDTFEGSLRNPFTQHGYAFVHNLPTNFGDPSGHSGYFDQIWAWVRSFGFHTMASDYEVLSMPPLPAQFTQVGLGSPAEPVEVIRANILATLQDSVFTWYKRVDPFKPGNTSPRSDWDYKYHWAERVGQLEGSAQYQLCADFGNFNYGVTGKAKSIPGWVLTSIGDILETKKDVVAVLTSQTTGVDPNRFAISLGWGATIPLGDEVDDYEIVSQGVEYFMKVKALNPRLK
jgi:RHS repeat-associated protein